MSKMIIKGNPFHPTHPSQPSNLSQDKEPVAEMDADIEKRII